MSDFAAWAERAKIQLFEKFPGLDAPVDEEFAIETGSILEKLSCEELMTLDEEKDEVSVIDESDETISSILSSGEDIAIATTGPVDRSFDFG